VLSDEHSQCHLQQWNREKLPWDSLENCLANRLRIVLRLSYLKTDCLRKASACWLNRGLKYACSRKRLEPCQNLHYLEVQGSTLARKREKCALSKGGCDWKDRRSMRVPSPHAKFPPTGFIHGSSQNLRIIDLRSVTQTQSSSQWFVLLRAIAFCGSHGMMILFSSSFLLLHPHHPTNDHPTSDQRYC